MYINTAGDDQISLTLLEFRVLTALASGPETSYGIAKAYAADDRAGGSKTISQGSLIPALRRFEQTGLIRRIDQNIAPTNPALATPGRPQVIYKLTPTGRLILQWHAETLQHLADLAQFRLRATTPSTAPVPRLSTPAAIERRYQTH